MAKKKPKKTRKELLKEPDEFITLTGKAIAFVGGHQKQISYVLGAIVASVCVVLGWWFFAQRAEAKAFSMLRQTMITYEAHKKTTSPEQAYKDVKEQLQHIVEKYGGNAGGKLARATYANISYNAGDYPTAIELYKLSLHDFKDNQMVYNLILSSLGTAYQQIEDNRNAALYLEKVASLKDSNLRDEALFNLGLLYEKLGDSDRSHEAFQQILSNYPNSIYFDMVAEKLSAEGLN